MFLEFYGLREQPFGVTPNPRYLYHSPIHREALASLIYGIEADLGFAALIADPGMGKTTLLFYLLEKFRATARTALIFQTLCSPLEFLRYLASELEISTNESDPVLLNERIKEVLVQEAQARRRVILIVDEAQNLDESVLETIRLLSDFETQNFKLLHIVLAGQLQLAEKLARPSMAQLLQRISMLNRLRPLTTEETKSYIEYRLNVAGYRGAPLFTKEAIELIALNSGGVPRKINRICFNALSLGCAMGKRTIDVQAVREVGNDLDIGDLLFQKGAITDELTSLKPTTAPAEESKQPPTAPPEVKESSSAPPAGSPVRQWPSFPSSPAQSPVASVQRPPQSPVASVQTPAQSPVASVQRPPQSVSRPLPERPLAAPARPVASSTLAGPAARPAASSAPPLAAPSSKPFVPGPKSATAAPARTPGYSGSRTSPQSTASVAPFPTANAAAPGISRPLSSAQPKPLPQTPPRPAQSAKPIVLPARKNEPPRQSRPVAFALASILCGVIAFAGWTVWVKSPAHESAAAATSGSAAPARNGQEIDVPAAADTSPNITGAIERGKSAVRQKQEDKSGTHDIVKVSAPRREASKPRGTGTTVVDFEQQPTPPSGEARAISAELIRKVPPIYPTEARRSGIQGSVTVAAVIGTDGRPKGVRALSGNPILARAATDAVNQWLYQPYYVNGRPVEVETEIVVDFTLR